MKARLSFAPERDTYDLRIAGDGANASRIEDGRIQWERRIEGAEVAVVLALTPHEMEAIARAFQQVTQASDATVDALADTREVRDRLLALVEQGWAG